VSKCSYFQVAVREFIVFPLRKIQRWFFISFFLKLFSRVGAIRGGVAARRQNTRRSRALLSLGGKIPGGGGVLVGDVSPTER